MNRHFHPLFVAALGCVLAGTNNFAADSTPPPKASLSAAPQAPRMALAKIHPGLLYAEGPVNVVIRLADPPLAVAAGRQAKQQGPRLTRAAQRAHVQRLSQRQEAVVSEVLRRGGTVTARLTKALNAVCATVDARALPQLALLNAVTSIGPLADYELDLSTTVPYIGAATLHALGLDGTGVRVAVLDTGVDYTHKNLGGPGTVAAYAAANANPTAIEPGTFPTAKVVGGYDFVGEVWPGGALAPDPDPLDANGHGTHVADIIAGASLDGTHRGVAPGATLYAFKVCSAVASACSGAAILQGLEAALDPNGDDDTSDAVDVVNLSLGSSYGQIQDDSALAVQNVVDFGVVVVASAGNSGDKPYVVGSPSIAPGAISVAQTQMPNAFAPALQITPQGQSTVTYYNTATVDWAPLTATISGEVVYAGLACSPLAPGSLSGKIALIDRGNCAVSLKVDAAADAGAIGVIIANNVSGDPPSFSFGGGDTMVPTLIITLADGNAIKSFLASGTVTATMDPSVGTPLGGSMASTSSRGPSFSLQTIKPDIGAPGGSLSAEVGTGDGQTAFGGTSGAAPMVAGAAALLLDANPGWSPLEIKARLMNTADPDVLINPVTLPGVPAPVTRIGAGEVRVDRALAATTLAYDRDTGAPSLSFGYRPVIKAGAAGNKFRRFLEIRNLSASSCTYGLSASFRYADDLADGAASLSFSPASVTVPPGGTKTVQVTLSLDGTKLPAWNLNGGAQGGNGERLRRLEVDGFVNITCNDQTVATVPWHVLPRKAADVRPTSPALTLSGPPGAESGTLSLKNVLGVANGVTELFELLGTDPVDYPVPVPPGGNQALVDLKALGVRAATFGDTKTVQFAVATYGEPAHPNYPAQLEVEIYTDADNNGTFEHYIVFNTENIGFAATGQNVVLIYDFQTDDIVSSGFFSDSDLNSGVVVLTVPLAALGMSDYGVPMAVFAYAADNYFTGVYTDYIADPGDEPMWFTPGKPRFFPTGTVSVPAGPATTAVTINHYAPGDLWSPSVDGLLLFHRNALPKRWSDNVLISVP